MALIYLDNCCFSRPFDDQTQDRIRLESEAVLLILGHVVRGEWELVRSEAIDLEVAGLRDVERRRRVEVLVSAGTYHVSVGEDQLRRGTKLESLGFGAYDALHIACAEAAVADVLLTTDDRFVRRARRLHNELGVPVMNPLTWLRSLVTE
ncbi:MAG TPA: PIN domain-containing protein [Longimicrobium sp.]|nr:PIN domain-containing protein [Longimicrobium sp.]